MRALKVNSNTLNDEMEPLEEEKEGEEEEEENVDEEEEPPKKKKKRERSVGPGVYGYNILLTIWLI